MKRISVFTAFVTAFATSAFAVTVSINFERADESAAIPGREATNMYVARGVRFPSRPTIQHDRANQVLQQGRGGTRPDPLPERIDCAPLEMEFSAAMGVRTVRMRVINRHLRSYSVQAFAGTVEVDVDNFFTTPPSGPPYRIPADFRDITLDAEASEGDITRVVVNPPSDCFDLAVIDNLVLETTHDVVAIDPVPEPNAFVITAYEVTQGTMSRLTWPPVGARESTPDTRLMALPDKQLRFIEHRDTAVRFFINATDHPEHDFDARLEVNVSYRDGSTRTKTVTENTEGGREAPVAPGGTLAARRAIVKRRARVDQSLDYVIPGRFLRNAASMRLNLLRVPGATPLITIRLTFDGPYFMGLNVARVQGIGLDASIAGPPSRVVTSLATQFVEDVYPISGEFIRLNEAGVLTMNTGTSGGCFPFLSALDATFAGTAAGAPMPGVNFWSNLYLLQNTPPDCGGLGWYNRAGALTNTSYSTVAHELSHNIGMNHVTNLHGEGGGGRGDWEPWPYTHGSIGAVDETAGFNDGVFGAHMHPNAGSIALDMITNWGTWMLAPIAPCVSTVDAQLFPTCTTPDIRLRHDYMTYGPTVNMPIWGSQHWVSDVNYHRAHEFFQTCVALDPPHRFQMGGTGSFTVTSGECRAADASSLTAAVERATTAAAGSQDALVFSGAISETGVVSEFRVLRKLAEAYAFANVPGQYTLIERAGDGSVLRAIPFTGKKPEGEVGGEGFLVVVPYDGKVASVEITLKQKALFSGAVSGFGPGVSLVSPKPGEVWGSGKHRIEWKLDQANSAKEIYVQYSVDKGSTWLPLGLLTGGQTFLDVDTADLRSTNDALIYVSASRGLDTGFGIMSQTFTIGQ